MMQPVIFIVLIFFCHCCLSFLLLLITFIYPFNTEADLEGGGGGHVPTPFFCNHFEELQTVLTEVKLIINNAP